MISLGNDIYRNSGAALHVIKHNRITCSHKPTIMSPFPCDLIAGPDSSRRIAEQFIPCSYPLLLEMSRFVMGWDTSVSDHCFKYTVALQ